MTYPIPYFRVARIVNAMPYQERIVIYSNDIDFVCHTNYWCNKAKTVFLDESAIKTDNLAYQEFKDDLESSLELRLDKKY